MVDFLIDIGVNFSLMLLLNLLLNITIVLFLIIKGVKSFNKDEKQGLGLYINKSDFIESFIPCLVGCFFLVMSNVLIIAFYVICVEEMTKMFLLSYFPLLFILLLVTYFIIEKVRDFPDRLSILNNLPGLEIIIRSMYTFLPFFIILDIVFFDFITFLISLTIAMIMSLGLGFLFLGSVQHYWYLTPQNVILVRSKFWFSKQLWEEKRLGKIVKINVTRHSQKEKGSLSLIYKKIPNTHFYFSNTNQLVILALLFAERFNISNSDIEIEGAEIKRLLGRETFYPQDPTEVRQIEPCKEFLEGIDSFRPFKRISNDPYTVEIGRIDPTKFEYSALIMAPVLVLLSIILFTGIIVFNNFGENLTESNIQVLLVLPVFTILFVFSFLKFIFGKKVMCFNNECLNIGYRLFNHIKFELPIPLELILNIQVNYKRKHEVIINYLVFDFVVGRFESNKSANVLSCFIKNHIFQNESNTGISSIPSS